LEVIVVAAIWVAVAVADVGPAFAAEESEAMAGRDHDFLQFLHVPSVVAALRSLYEDCLVRFSALQQYGVPNELDQYQAHSMDLKRIMKYAP
jgi:hypothetical protein